MISAQTSKKRLAAIDLDGTLLGPNREVSPENQGALVRLHEAGFHVVLATGRHHLNVLPFAVALPQVEWIVSAQGAEASDVLRRTTLLHTYLDAPVAHELTLLGERLGYAVVVYAHEGIFAVSSGQWAQFYAELSGAWPRAIRPDQLLCRRVFKILWLHEESLVARIPELPELAGFGVYQVRTHEHIVEFLSPHASKAVGTRAVAAHLGVPASQVVAFGDGENDIPLFEWAGLSVAMPHGWPRARSAASMTAPPGTPATALAAGVDLVLARLGLTASAA
jgi:Cof subfamily protein (haloacid dehalogenase superfamily)